MFAAPMPSAIATPDQSPANRLTERDAAYAGLMSASSGERNDHLFARILASWQVGVSVLPARLGLSPAVYRALFDRHFPGLQWAENETGRDELDDERLPERDDLIHLMMDARAGRDESELWMAEIVATACIGMDHLWQDLGLWSRKELSELMQHNFPPLAARNDRDMKWKKFLYKQLCEQEGIYVCRAPSCDVCGDYLVCFGPEE